MGGKVHGGGSGAADDNPFSTLAQAEEDITSADGNTDAEEGKTAEEVDHSDDSAEHVPLGHGGGFPTMAAMQHANPGGVFIPLTHPNYTSFFKKHLNSPSPGLRLPSDSFTRFLNLLARSIGSNLSPGGEIEIENVHRN